MKRPVRTNNLLKGFLVLVLLCINTAQGDAAGQPRILVVKSNNIPSYNAAVEGFRAAADPNWQIVEHDLRGTYANATKISNMVKSENADLIAAIGAKAVTALTKAKISTPIVFCAATIVEPAEIQAANTTGVFLATSRAKQLEILASFGPGVKRIGALIHKETAADTLDLLTTLAAQHKLDIVPIPLTGEKEMPHRLRPVVEQIDALWMVDDSYIYSMETLKFVIVQTLENKIIFMANSEAFVKEGALIALAPSFFDNGKQAAELVKRLLTENKQPREIPISLHKNPNLVINLKIAGKIGVTIPAELLERAGMIYE